MKDDILRLRKCVEILKKEKNYTNLMVCQEMGISDPTFYKLMKTDISELKPRASVLAIVQDFIKKHCNDLNYAGIKPAPESVQKMKKSLVNYKEPEQPIEKKTEEPINELEITPENADKGETAKRLSKHPYFSGKDPEEEKPEVKPEPALNPFDLFLQALKMVPSNVSIVISINEK